MFVRKFEAPSLEEALTLVKDTMGPNALVLSTENKDVGLFRKPLVEVTAACEKRPPGPGEKPRSRTEIMRRLEAPPAAPHEDTAPPATNFRKVRAQRYVEIGDKGEASASLRGISFEDEFIQLGFDAESAKDLGRILKYDYPKEDLQSPRMLEKIKLKLVLQHLKTLTPAVLPVEREWILLGAPGSGKTTLAVKLALFAKQQGHKVSLNSCDDRKLLGARELHMYAKAIGISSAPKKLINNVDVMLWDSPAFGQDDGFHKLRESCSGKAPVLVLDASMRLREMQAIASLVEPLRPRAVCFTRLDLVREKGIVFDFLKRSRLPLLGLSLSASFKIAFRFLEPPDLARYILQKREVNA